MLVGLRRLVTVIDKTRENTVSMLLIVNFVPELQWLLSTLIITICDCIIYPRERAPKVF